MKQKIRFRSVKNRQVFWFLIVGLLPLMVVSTVIYNQRVRFIKEEAFHKLTAIRDLKVDQVNSWLNERVGDLEVISNDHHLTHVGDALKKDVRSQDDLHIISAARALMNRYIENVGDYHEIFIIDSISGLIEISTDKSKERQNKSKDRCFTEPMRTGEAFIKEIYFSATLNRPSMSFSIPLYSDLHNDEHITGILVARVDLENSLYALLLNRIGMGETGETLIINKNVMALNELRWHDNAPLKLQIEATPAIRASKGETGITETEDYRNEKVLAAYAYIPKAKWGFVSKQDIAEVYAPIQFLLWQIVILFCLSLAVVYSLAILLSKNITKPVIEMTEMSKRIQEGDYSVRNQLRTDDELSYLAETINNMADSIQTSQYNLEQLVNERTTDLIRTNEKLKEEVTERKEAEDALLKQQGFLQQAQELGHIGSWELDIKKNELLWTDENYRIFGLPIGTELTYEAFLNCVHPDDREYVDTKWNSTFTGTPYDIEHRLMVDGKVKWVREKAEVQFDEKNDAIRGTGYTQEITERKRMEEELLRAQKLESVGVLAGGIAHDFNNILTTLFGNISLARMQMRPEDEVFELLSEAETASMSAQALTKQLLTFAKGGAPIKDTASVKDILKESSAFVLRGSKSRCEFSIQEDLWSAEVDVGQISQVVNNIVINANQAIPEGGDIRIAAENLIIEDRHGLPVKPGRYIKISFKDQGIGIAGNHLLNIFDPYFTTKQEGSGLGLATTFSIIKKHDGHITVESQLGVGTTFHIYLPASEKAAPEREDDRLITGHGRILVMDDDVSLRRMLGRMLGKLGYESESAEDGAEAIDMYKAAKESGKPYDIVIMDLTIPGGMGGKEAINKLLEIYPEVKAIVYSGYSGDSVLANFQEYGFKGMMLKPFEPLSLGKVLREVLQGEKE